MGDGIGAAPQQHTRSPMCGCEPQSPQFVVPGGHNIVTRIIIVAVTTLFHKINECVAVDKLAVGGYGSDCVVTTLFHQIK